MFVHNLDKEVVGALVSPQAIEKVLGLLEEDETHCHCVSPGLSRCTGVTSVLNCTRGFFVCIQL